MTFLAGAANTIMSFWSCCVQAKSNISWFFGHEITPISLVPEICSQDKVRSRQIHSLGKHRQSRYSLSDIYGIDKACSCMPDTGLL
jgi:hypothetical protein